MLLLDLTHTCHTHARTGIQKVTRALHAALAEQTEVVPVTHDPYARGWRTLQPWEQANLDRAAPGKKRGAKWPLRAQLRGRITRWLGTPATVLSNGASGLVVPEIFSPAVAVAWPALFAQTKGPRVALFHDAIALKFPELSPPKTVARFPVYLRELLAFDGIAAVSEDSRDTLLDYWSWLGIADHPPVVALPLAVEANPHAATSAVRSRSPSESSIILSVGSLEGRKNHLQLLSACETLWSRGLRFELHLIGLAQAQTGREALAKVHALQAAGRPLRYDGPVDDNALEAAYADCAFTVYPSLMEGFGLPVIESLERGKPCICSSRGALGESARGGGCITLETVDAANLARAMERLLVDSALRNTLSGEAQQRQFKRWTDYATELLGWMSNLPLRSRT